MHLQCKNDCLFAQRHLLQMLWCLPRCCQPCVSGCPLNLVSHLPHIKCAKRQADAMDLYVDRKDGRGFVLIGRLLKLDYIDKAPLPIDNAILEWSDKGRYVVGNDVVGLMSSVTGVMVRKI
jgi:hypothetical protein